MDQNWQRWKAPTCLESREVGWSITRLIGATQKEEFQSQGDKLLQRVLLTPDG